MMKRHLCLPVLIVVAVGLSGCVNGTDSLEEGKKVSFTSDIKPILERQCINCHNSETLPGKLSFENAKGAFVNDSQGRPYIVAGKPAESRLFTAAIAPDFQDLAMPPVGHRVAKSDTDNFHQWILEGAEWPDGPEGTLVATEKAME
jgi:hypothetical protein